MSAHFYWNDEVVPFRPGETIAAAMIRAGVVDFGSGYSSIRAKVFCGIGACQACVVIVDCGAALEACLTLARQGMTVGPVPTVGGLA